MSRRPSCVDQSEAVPNNSSQDGYRGWQDGYRGWQVESDYKCRVSQSEALSGVGQHCQYFFPNTVKGQTEESVVDKLVHMGDVCPNFYYWFKRFNTFEDMFVVDKLGIVQKLAHNSWCCLRAENSGDMYTRVGPDRQTDRQTEKQRIEKPFQGFRSYLPSDHHQGAV